MMSDGRDVRDRAAWTWMERLLTEWMRSLELISTDEAAPRVQPRVSEGV